MANWYGFARTNYFAVKDRAAFDEEMASLDMEVVEDEGKVAVLARTDDGSFPSYRFDDDEDPEEIDFAQLLATHLAPDQVAILMEVGAEKMRYLTGWATAVNELGQEHHIALHDIYDFAREMGKDVTAVSY